MKLRIDQFGVNDKILGRYAGPIHLTNDKPVLRFEGEDRDLGLSLWIGDTQAGHIWHTGDPTSLYYYQLSSGESSLLPPELVEWEKLVQNRLPEELPLEKLLEPFKPLLPTGEYWLVYSYPDKLNGDFSDWEPAHFMVLPESEQFWDTTDPPTAYFEYPNYFETQNAASLYPSRIEHYQESIRNGMSPVIICYSRFVPEYYIGPEEMIPVDEIMDESNPYFILDGHHKARAYEALNRGARKEQAPIRWKPGILHIAKVEKMKS